MRIRSIRDHYNVSSIWYSNNYSKTVVVRLYRCNLQAYLFLSYPPMSPQGLVSICDDVVKAKHKTREHLVEETVFLCLLVSTLERVNFTVEIGEIQQDFVNAFLWRDGCFLNRLLRRCRLGIWWRWRCCMLRKSNNHRDHDAITNATKANRRTQRSYYARKHTTLLRYDRSDCLAIDQRKKMSSFSLAEAESSAKSWR